MAPLASPSSAARLWGIRLSLLAGSFAVVLALQPHLIPRGIFSQASSNRNQIQTYCYQAVRTAAIDDSDGQDNNNNNNDNNNNNKANCFSVDPRDGTFARVFSSHADVGEEGEQKLDIRPGYVLPGLWDGHGHLIQYGEFLHSADLFGSDSPGEVRRRLRAHLDKNPGLGSRENWVRGIGWDQMVMGGMPTADMLEEDEALKGKYFMLDRVDVHCTWVSQAVLDLLPADLPEEVPGGEIVRAPGMGVFCDNAMDLVTSLWPKPSAERKRTFVASAMRELHKVGLVGMHDAGVLPQDIALYDEMSRTDDDWTLRVYAMIECPERNTFCPDKAVKVQHPHGMLSVRSVKLFADGALGSWGSAMLTPYADRPDTSGSLLVNASTLTALARSWSAAGFQVNIHAIGDLANRLAIDALEAALNNACPTTSSSSPSSSSLSICQSQTYRHRLEHAQIIHPLDQARLLRLGILPSIQPTHATSDMAYAERRLGPERTDTEAYRMRSLLERGARLVLGSDFPVEPPSPFEGMYAAVARRSPRTGNAPAAGVDGGGGEGGWHMEEVLTLAQALDGFTRGAARGAFLEGKAGVIREGAFADWVVLDEDLEAGGVEGLRRVKVRETWVGGRRVYRRGEEEEGGGGVDGGDEREGKEGHEDL